MEPVLGVVELRPPPPSPGLPSHIQWASRVLGGVVCPGHHRRTGREEPGSEQVGSGGRT